MSTIEKLFVQIFERKKWIIDQAKQQTHLFDQHLASKLLIDGIAPPPWLRNPMLHYTTSDPKEFNREELISEVLFPQSQSGIPFSSRLCSLNKLGVTTDNHYLNGSHGEIHALNKDCEVGYGVSLLPECSGNDGGCASNGVPWMDSFATSPQNQINALDNYHAPALSLARVQRSKSRQRALKLRNSAKAAKGRSETYDCVDNIDFIKSFETNIDSCAVEDVKTGDFFIKTNGNANYSARISSSRSSAKKLNSLNVVDSSFLAKEGDTQSNNSMVKQLEPANPSHFTIGSFGVREESIGNVHQGRLTRSRSSNRQDKWSDELLKLDSSLDRGKEVVMRSADHLVDLTELRNTSDNVACGQEAKLGAWWNKKQESVVLDRRKVPGSSSPPQTSNSQDAKGSEMPLLRSSPRQKFSGLCEVKSRSHSRRISCAGEHSSQESSHLPSENHTQEISKSVGSNICCQRVTRSRLAASNKSHNASATEIFAGRSSSSHKNSKLCAVDATDFADKENGIVEYAADTEAKITCKTEGLSRPVSFSYLGSKVVGLRDSAFIKPPLVKLSNWSEAIEPEKVSDTQENVLSIARTICNVQLDRSAALTKQTDSDSGGLVEHHSACSGIKLTGAGLKIGLEVLVSRPPTDCVMILKPKQLEFDDIEEYSLNRISSPALEEETQGKSPEKLDPENLLGKVASVECQENCNSSLKTPTVDWQEVLIEGEGTQIGYYEGHVKGTDETSEPLNAISSIKEMLEVEKDLSTHIENGHDDTRIDLSLEKATEDYNAVKPTELDLEDSKLDSDAGVTKLSTDAGFAEVTRTAQPANLDDTGRDLTVDYPSVVVDEVKGDLMHQVTSLGISLSQTSEFSPEKWVNNGNDAGCSTEHQSAKSSMQRSFTSDVEHSCPQNKRRKIEGQPAAVVAASTSLLEKQLESDNRKTVRRYLNITEVRLKDMEQNDEGCMTEGLSPKLEADEGKHILEGRHGSANTSFTFTLNEIGASLVSILTEQGTKDTQNSLMEQVDEASKCTIDQNPVPLHLTDNCGLEIEKYMNNVERTMQERRFNLGGYAKLSYSSPGSLDSQRLDIVGADESKPEFEGFIMQPDDPKPCLTEDRFQFGELKFSSNRIEYSTILEQLHNSASMYSPSSCSSTAYRLHKIPDAFQSVPNGLLEDMNRGSSLPVNDDSQSSHSDGLPSFNGQSPWDTGKPHTSPIQTLWDRITSNFGSSGKRGSLNPELPCINEENENLEEVADTFQKGIGSEVMTSSVRREPLADITDNTNPPVSVSQDDIFANRCSIESVNTEYSFTGTQNRVKQNQNRRRRKYTKMGKENQGISFGENGAKRISESLRNRVSKPKLSGKTIIRKGGPTFTGRMSTRSNIVSNISSFIPLVQQKQAVAALTGKRDIKVKALEAAETAKRLAEKKDNERKMKKEALRIQRERSEQETLRQLELQKIKKEEERKQKVAEMAAKKRQREEDKRKEKERKRKRVDEARKLHLEQEKLCAKKEEKARKILATVERVQESKKSKEEHQKLEKEKRSDFLKKVLEIEPVTTRIPENVETKASIGLEDSEALSYYGSIEKETGNLAEATDDDNLVNNTLEEQSYDISPYKGSDDEDEDEDDIPNSKFIPSWASKRCLSQVVPSQKLVDPETIFPPQSFCDIAEVLLPQKLQIK
ncbi:Inner centromere protein, ARK-binding domain containing protein [Quillaja saponaria]|uniref:Inner centromere protein, ARK-binding domain containing protein n=1 Tax=Quillaja saponaria TaxID=32244 RepID=A0AAD7VGJ0_QUISA|nr:Inner centromere protein, ARK-binding domain containing protein [Quillaja saponaria]